MEVPSANFGLLSVFLKSNFQAFKAIEPIYIYRTRSVDGQHGSNLAHKVKNMRTSGRVGSVDGADASTHSHDSTIENHSSNPHSLIEKLKDYGAGNPNYTSFTDVDLSSSGPGSNRGQHSSSASKSSSAAATSAEPLCQTCRRVECMRDRSPFDMCKFQHVQVRHDDRRRGRE